MAEITIVVPIYKVERFLPRCVESILGQSYSDFELVLVDDGSPDNCGKMCNEYATHDPRIIVIHQANGGLSAARNTGIEWAITNSNSKWITFIDSDDWVHHDFLLRLYTATVNNDISVSVVGAVDTFSTESEFPLILTEQVKTEYCSPEVLWLKNRNLASVAWAKLYKRDLFEELRYPIGRINEDEFTTYKLLFCRDRIAYTPQKLYAYFLRDDSIMRTSWTPKRLHGLTALKEQIEFFDEKGFPQSKKKSADAYMRALSAGIRNCKKYKGADAASVLKNLKKEKKQAVKNYFGKWKYPISQNLSVLEEFYPKTARVFRKVNNLFHKKERIK